MTDSSTALLLRVFTIVFYAALVLAIVFLILTVLLFFLLKIRDVRAELSGKTRDRVIQTMGQQQTAPGAPVGSGLSGSLSTGGMMLTDQLPVSSSSHRMTATASAAGSQGLRKTGATGFTIQKEILLIHTQESI